MIFLIILERLKELHNSISPFINILLVYGDDHSEQEVALGIETTSFFEVRKNDIVENPTFSNAHKKELDTETSSVQINLEQKKTPTSTCWSFKYVENSKKLIS